ncbi:hypothetical protein [Aquisphaera insulae]|uniref:hypothetical protein n=1 Tax=Aquisphaera insulae TaxID=2712864 RepID=UPI0013ED8613|nr:hypothetical protein [Aquisphaera insulae]
MIALLAGLVAGLAAFGLGEAVHDYYKPENAATTLNGNAVSMPTIHTMAVAHTRNMAIAYSILGGCLGLCLGLAGGIAGGGTRRGAAAGAAGLVLGILAGRQLPLALAMRYSRYMDAHPEADMLLPMAMHGTYWGVLGLIGGLVFGIGLGRGFLKFALLGLAGALAGTVLCEIAGVFLDPLAETSDPLFASLTPRLIARLGVALGAAAAIGFLGMRGDASGEPIRPHGARA